MFGVYESKVLMLFSKLSVSAPEAFTDVFNKFYPEVFPDEMKQSEQSLDYIDLKSWMADRIANR